MLLGSQKEGYGYLSCYTKGPGVQCTIMSSPVTLPVPPALTVPTALPTVPAVLPAPAECAPVTPATRALATLLADSRSPQTRAAYASDLRDFFRWRGDGHGLVTPEAVEALCRIDNTGEMSLLLNRYKAHLRDDRKLSEATVNRRLAALRSLLHLARTLGAPCPDPGGLVKSEKVVGYRDTRGPALRAAAQLVAAPDRATAKGKRDYAILLLLCENALRRNEIISADVGDFRPDEKRLFILGKGRGSQKQPVTLSDVATAALADHLKTRGTPGSDAPLFLNASVAFAVGQRLSGKGLAKLVDTYGRRVIGRPLHPHALRHMAITATLDATGGDLRTAQRLSRHTDIRTLQFYDDNREDLQGRATNLLSSLLHAQPALTPAGPEAKP